MSTETDRERTVDRIVWRRLETDGAYQNAANAEEQAAREDEIAEEVLEAYNAKHGPF